MIQLRRLLAEGYYRATGRGIVIDRVDDFEALYRSSRATIDRYVETRLSSILRHASATVPYYKELIGDESISGSTAAEFLSRFPIMTKGIIRRESARLVSTAPGTKPRENTSGGSTGEPIRLLQDREMGRESRSGELLFARWAGHTPGEPHVLIWGVPEAAFNQQVSLHERAFRFVQNETYLNCYRITDAMLDEWARRLNRIRPTLIEAYVDALTQLSARILKTGIRVSAPRGIIVSAGVLTPIAEETINAAFAALIFNRYGSREVGNVACSCGLGRELHIHEAWSFLEIVDDDGNSCAPGVEGNILVTVFANRTMPLIRYQIEDRGSWAVGECSCGRTTKRLASVSGRKNEYLVTKDGTRIDGVAIATYTALSSLVNVENGIQRFQYRQSEKGRVTLAVVPSEGASHPILIEQLNSSVTRLHNMFAGLEVEIKIEDEILPSKSGKFRYILNEMKNASSESSAA